MKAYLKRLWMDLWSEDFSETAKCELCGAVVSKTRMVKESVYGWFCNEEEFRKYWLSNQV